MNYRADKSRKPPQEGNPGGYSAGPPTNVGADHSFTLQAIMDLAKSMGQVVESINGMSKRIDDLSGRIEKLEEKVSSITHKLYAAGIVMAISVAVGGFVINKASDLAVGVINKAATTIIEQPPPDQKPTKK